MEQYAALILRINKTKLSQPRKGIFIFDLPDNVEGCLRGADINMLIPAQIAVKHQ
jgi:hypothetical protein